MDSFLIYLYNTQVREQTNVKREDEDQKKEKVEKLKATRQKTNLIQGDNYKIGGSKGPEFGKEEEEQTDAV